MLYKAKTHITSVFGVRKGLLIEEMGDLMIEPQNHLVHWPRGGLLKGWGGKTCGSPGG